MVSTAISNSAVARVVGIKTEFKDLRAGSILFLPQRVALIGQGATAATYLTTKTRYTSALAVGQAYGFGSPVHLAAKQLLPANGDGIGSIPLTVYPLEDDGSGVAATGDITPVGAATASGQFTIYFNEIAATFVISEGDAVADVVASIVAAVSAQLDMPATIVDNAGASADFTAKWAGVTSNDIIVRVEGPDVGITFGITQANGGLVDPDIQTALDQFGDVWETCVVNCLGPNTTALEALATFNEGRWLPTVVRPFISFYGSSETDPNTAITVPESYKTDRTNSQIVAPGSEELPWVIAARAVARIAVVANDNPPRDYGSQKLTGLVPGSDSEQWDYNQRDLAVKGGSSTTEVKDGVVNLSDTVTFYHPTNDPTPAYRYVCDIFKVMQLLFNTQLIFKSEDWDGAPLIPDDQATVNPTAKKPKMATAEIAALVDSAALNAIISDPEFAKSTIQSEIDDQNPKRLNSTYTVKISGNSNIISVDFNFGFFFGTAAVVA